jgi:hypothetical protein
MKMLKICIFFFSMNFFNNVLSVKKKIIKKKSFSKKNQLINKSSLSKDSHDLNINNLSKKSSLIEVISNFFKKIWQLIKDFFKRIKNLLGKKEENKTVEKEKLLLKIVTTANVKGQLINEVFNVNGILMAKKKEAISIPAKMENLKMIYVLPDHINYVKKDTKLVEFDVKQLEIQYKKNQEQIDILQDIQNKEQQLLEKGGISKKETLEIESRLNKIVLEQEVLQDQLSNTIIKAPFDGIISRPEKNETGQNVRIKRTDLFIIHDPKTLLMEGYINGSIFEEISLGDESIVTIFHNKNQIVTGKVITKELFSEQNTGLYRILISIDVESQNNLIGQPAQAIIKSKKTTYLTKIPEKSIFFDNGKMAVFIIIKHQAIKRNIVVEKAEGQWVYVTGLPQECVIITDEANVLNNGDFVKPNKILNIEDDIIQDNITNKEV